MMNLKDKKITQCHYVDSKGKTYNVGYGDDLHSLFYTLHLH